jgi:hypothetical protein
MLQSFLSSHIANLKKEVEENFGWHIITGVIGKGKADYMNVNTTVNKFSLLP